MLTTLGNIYRALEPSGRFVCIGAYARRDNDPKDFFSPQEQMEIARSCGRFRAIARFPHQVVPPGWYRRWNAQFLNLLDHKLARIASVRLVWVLEKVET